MDTIVNAIAAISGLWKKAASLLPLLVGAGSVLVGAGNIALALGHAADAAAALHIIQGLGAGDPNVMLIVGGLTALGVHTNHQDVVAQVQAAPVPAPAQPPTTPSAP